LSEGFPENIYRNLFLQRRQGCGGFLDMQGRILRRSVFHFGQRRRFGGGEMFEFHAGHDVLERSEASSIGEIGSASH